ncbi:restriction endonuclease subunit S, partial [Auritidibacter sp. NML120779]
RHVEVFQMACVGTSIIGRPRPLSSYRRATSPRPPSTPSIVKSLQIDPLVADYRFVMYWIAARYEDLKSRGRGARSDLNSNLILTFPIFLPPLERQKIIADVLDDFDALVNDLSSGLPAEIEARGKQYEYYRDKLLTFKELESDAA